MGRDSKSSAACSVKDHGFTVVLCHLRGLISPIPKIYYQILYEDLIQLKTMMAKPQSEQMILTSI